MGNKNFCALIYDAATNTQKWVWMSNSQGPITSAPLAPNSPIYGLYPDSGVTLPNGTLQPFVTTVIVVVPNAPVPTGPPSWWQVFMQAFMSNNVIVGSGFAS
jgi:hypothetical protein